MSGDWIKMRADLFTHPKVVRMMSALKADKFRIVGGLMSAWCLFDAHSIDGCLEGYTPDALDSMIGFPGLSAAMQAVGWLEYSEGNGLSLPEFERHNGQSAKRRAQESDRKREARKTSASDADKKRTREEKRRNNKDYPQPPAGANPPIAFKTWLEQVKASSEKPIQPDDPIFDYCASVGIPESYLTLHWLLFKRRYLDVSKRYRDWRKVFRNSVKGNWMRVWALRDGQDAMLTTVGEQARREFEHKEAA